MKYIFKYLVSTKYFGLTFTLEKPSSLAGYTDSDYEGCLDVRILLYVRTRIQLVEVETARCTTTSTTEAEYIAASDAAKEAL